ncbi:response regulator [Actinomadura kijaniata]|uniref:response regulator n=1 Tax=Actinomadura kijaniata TaxID=46161 RepID=UPI003F1AF0C5
MIRVLVADDEPLIVEGVRAVLEAHPDLRVVATAADGRQAVEEARRHRPDVAVLDVTMPVMDGLAALEHLTVPAVMLTAFGDEPNVVRALERRAAGFVLKNHAPDELVRAVRAAHAGEAYLSPAITRMVLSLVDPAAARRRAEARARLAALSPRETEVLRLLAEGRPNAAIGRRLHMTEASIKTYVSRILAKLSCDNRVQAAMLLRDAEDPVHGG